MPSFSKVLTERNSIRQFQKSHIIPQYEIDEMIQLAQTAPSAWNLQHWRVIVVQDPAHKKNLLPIANNQQQVEDASVVFIILGDLEADKNTEFVYLPLVQSGDLPEQTYKHLLDDIKEEYENRKHKSRDSAFLNASLFAMQLMLAAKSKGYDTVPMRGFQAEELVAELRIPERFVPVMIIAAGIASKQAHATTRLPLDRIVIRESF
jgi:nitroreductase